MAMRKRIADEVADMMIFEKCGTFGKDGTLVRLFDVVFERHKAIFAGLIEQVVHHFQRIHICLFGEFGAAKDPADASGNLFENVKRVSDEDGTNGGTADGDEFGGLDENAEIPVLHEIAANHAAKNNDDADNCKHILSRLLNLSTMRCLRRRQRLHRDFA